MSLWLTALISGVTGVFLVMFFLLIMVNLSSKFAISLEQRQSTNADK
ncbi:MAG: oxaloacetate decarboxylase subunit gamma [Syntrophomonadales bacterium]|jgi:Na+-transporting methylmalonyl-CoA/oxaloacetate decarboxylase gamma subunit